MFFQCCLSYYRWKGLRDDLVFLLEEDLSNISICCLHCELRNTEQMLLSLGFLAHEIGSLKECNAILEEYGPESMRGKDRIFVKPKTNQESRVERRDMQVKSFGG